MVRNAKIFDASLWSVIFDATTETLSVSSYHGLPNMVNNPYKHVKIIWFFFTLLATAYCAYTIFSCTALYLEYKVVTQVELEWKHEMVFPIVKVCRTDIGNLPNVFPMPDGVIKLQMYTTFIRNRLKSNPAIYRTLGITNFQDVLISCIYNLMNCNLTHDFSYFYDFRYGSCWRFNAGYDMNGKVTSFKTSNKVGSLFGLQLELYAGLMSENNNLFSIGHGYDILISNETMDSSSRKGIQISPGYSIRVSLEKYSVVTQPKPYTECISNLVSEDSYGSKCYKLTIASAKRQNKYYHWSDCSYMCFQKLLGDKCNCQASVAEPYYEEKRTCTEFSDLLCVKEIYSEFINQPNLLVECDCPFGCFRYDFALTTSMLSYPTKFYSDFLLENNPLIQKIFANKSSNDVYENMKNSITSISIFYDQLKEFKVSQDIKMVAFDLLGQIGANLGLFVGASLLTAIEVCEIILQAIIIAAKSNMMNQNMIARPKSKKIERLKRFLQNL